eukprot:gnl/MRDRNA2_/MRDRNA2_80323_c0_seq1.p1 gnl/MRDRNA2_/MRDRNA2_80323_c0~~gnl/MRDRNA2_/MRDRNA2_80323_c0_seq1.p1  ORF type:complete len:1107 (-),score=218.12 gnl/MRDRNA2_/MRDRNA2_80323_c0_seq1:12-3332(-)
MAHVPAASSTYSPYASGQVTPQVSETPERWDDIGPMRIQLGSLQLSQERSDENVNLIFNLQQQTGESIKDLQTKLNNVTEFLSTKMDLIAEKVQLSSAEKSGANGSGSPAHQRFEQQAEKAVMMNDLKLQQNALLKQIEARHAEMQAWQADMQKKAHSQHLDVLAAIQKQNAQQTKWEVQQKTDLQSLKEFLSQHLRPLEKTMVVESNGRSDYQEDIDDEAHCRSGIEMRPESTEGEIEGVSTAKHSDNRKPFEGFLETSEGFRKRKGQIASKKVVDEPGPATGSDAGGREPKKTNGKSKPAATTSSESSKLASASSASSNLAAKSRYQEIISMLRSTKSRHSGPAGCLFYCGMCLVVCLIIYHTTFKLVVWRANYVGGMPLDSFIDSFYVEQNASLDLHASKAGSSKTVEAGGHHIEDKATVEGKTRNQANQERSSNKNSESNEQDTIPRAVAAARIVGAAQDVAMHGTDNKKPIVHFDSEKPSHEVSPGIRPEQRDQEIDANFKSGTEHPSPQDTKVRNTGPKKHSKDGRQSQHSAPTESTSSSNRKSSNEQAAPPDAKGKSKQQANPELISQDGGESHHTASAESSDMMDEEWNVNARDSENRTKLHNALRLGDALAAKSIIDNSLFTELTAVDVNGWTALHTAAYHGVKDIVKSLLRDMRLGPVLNAQDSKGRTAIHYAASQGQYDIVVTLMSNGRTNKHVDALDNEGKTPLHLAAEAGKDLCVRLFLAKKEFKGVNAKDFMGMSGLHYAAANGHASTALEFLDSKRFTEVAAKDNIGSNALHHAATKGHLKVVQDLTKHKRFVEACYKQVGTEGEVCDPDVSSVLGTCMGNADLKGRMCTQIECEELCTITPDCNFMYWVKSGHNQGQCKKAVNCQRTRQVDKKVFADVYQIFSKNFCKLVSAENADGSTALTLAVKEGHKDVTLALLKNPDFDKVNAVGKSCSGWTALHHAVAFGHAEVVQAILHHKLFEGVNAKDSQGSTALHLAASRGHSSMVEILLEDTRVAPNSRDNRGYTSLHVAAEQNHLKVVKVLTGPIRKNRNVVNLKSRDKKYRSALDIAEQKKHHKIVAALKEAIRLRGDDEKEQTVGSAGPARATRRWN